MAKKKEEPKYIGRYGEVLEDVEEIESPIDPSEPIRLRGWGVDEKGVKREVVFQVSRKTGKKHGYYLILLSKEEKKKMPYACEPVESCWYISDKLNGEDRICLQQPTPLTHGSYKRTYFLRGRQLEGREIEHYQYDCTEDILGRIEKEEREEGSVKAHDIRKFLEDSSIIEAIKTGDPVKVRNAAARVAIKNAKKKEMGE
ncbi:MAG: hypothetical protein IKQ99_03595 [Alphaproteobacteria bacterium]|nr:hypothetical protein [Alphaproteobacteria bacterium]